MNKALFLFFCCLGIILNSPKSHAQQDSLLLDSLQTVLKEQHVKGNLEEELNTLLALTIAYFDSRAFQKSVDTAIRLLQMLEEAGKGQTTFALETYSHIVGAYYLMGNYEQVLIYSRKGIELGQKIPANNSLAIIYMDYGSSLNELGDAQACETAYRNALAIATKTGNERSKAASYMFIGGIYKDVYNKLDSAYHYYLLAEEAFKKLNNVKSLLKINEQLSLLYYLEKKHQQALTTINRSTSICMDPNPSTGCRSILYTKAIILYELEQLDSAWHYSQLALNQAQRTDDLAMEWKSLYSLSVVEEKKGDYKAALDFLWEMIDVKDQIYRDNIEQALATERVKQDIEKEQAAREKAELQTSLLATQNSLFRAIGIGLLTILFIGGGLLWQLFRTRSALRSSNEQLHNLNATKDKFFGLIAHDIRNPVVALSGVGGQLRYYLENNKTQKLNRLADRIEQTADRLSSLLDNLLQWALLQTGMIPYQPEAINLHEIATENMELHQETASFKNIELKNTVPPDLMAYADPRAVSTVVRNLLSNALKFTPSGGQVSLQANSSYEEANLIVSDTGRGMSIQEAEKIFSLTSKSKQGTAGEKGSGLGLVLCQELIQLNQGSIRVESKEGEGSQFQFSLPAVV